MAKRTEQVVVDSDWSIWKQMEQASIILRDFYPKANVALIGCIWVTWTVTAWLLSKFVL